MPRKKASKKVAGKKPDKHDQRNAAVHFAMAMLTSAAYVEWTSEDVAASALDIADKIFNPVIDIEA